MKKEEVKIEDTFNIKFESSTEKFTIKIKTEDFDKFAMMIHDACIDAKVGVDIVKEELNGKEKGE